MDENAGARAGVNGAGATYYRTWGAAPAPAPADGGWLGRLTLEAVLLGGLVYVVLYLGLSVLPELRAVAAAVGRERRADDARRVTEVLRARQLEAATGAVLRDLGRIKTLQEDMLGGKK